MPAAGRNSAGGFVELAAEQQVEALNEPCMSCHRPEYAAWKSDPHGATYARIFLDQKHNTKNMLMDDCLRCPGMQK